MDIPDEDPPLTETPEAPLDGTPKTGDSGVTALWAVLCAGSLAGMAVVLGKERKKEEA